MQLDQHIDKRVGCGAVRRAVLQKEGAHRLERAGEFDQVVAAHTHTSRVVSPREPHDAPGGLVKVLLVATEEAHLREGYPGAYLLNGAVGHPSRESWTPPRLMSERLTLEGEKGYDCLGGGIHEAGSSVPCVRGCSCVRWGK